MNATDRAYSNIEILLARAAGATGSELARRFGLTERQIRRILTDMRANRRGQDIEAAHGLAQHRLTELYEIVHLVHRAVRELSDPHERIRLGVIALEYFREIREIEELLGRFPKEIDWKFKGSDAGWLWVRFKSVIKRHPGAWDEFYDELFFQFNDWVEGQLERQGKRGHKSLGKMSGISARTAPSEPSGLRDTLRDELCRSLEHPSSNAAATSAAPPATGSANPSRGALEAPLEQLPGEDWEARNSCKTSLRVKCSTS